MSKPTTPRFEPDPSRPYQYEHPFLALWLPRGRGKDDLAEGLLCLPARSTVHTSDPTKIHLDCTRIDDRLAWAKRTSKGLSLSWLATAADRPAQPFEHLRLDVASGIVRGLHRDELPEALAPFFARPLPAWLLDELFATALPLPDPGPPDVWLERALHDWKPGLMASHMDIYPARRPEIFGVGGKWYGVDTLFCLALDCRCDQHRFCVFEVAGDVWQEVASAELDPTRTAVVGCSGDRSTLDAVFAAWKDRVVHPAERFAEDRARVHARAARIHAEYLARKPAPPSIPPPPVDPPRVKPGRNDPCPCHSGKKYKHCHGR